MAYSSDFDKYIKGGSTPKTTTTTPKTTTTSTPKKVDVSGIKLKDSGSTTIKTSKGSIKLRDAFKKIIYGAAVVGTTVGLGLTGFGAGNIIAIASLPQFNFISFETMAWALVTGAGYKLTKATLGTTMRNTPGLKNIYDAVTGAKEELDVAKGSKK